MSNDKQMSEQPLSSAVSVEEEINPHKRLREDSSLVLPSDLSKLSDILDSLSSDENSIKQAVALILQKDNFKTAIAGILVPEIAGLRSEIEELSTRLDEMEQYSRRNCLKISGIPEEKNENTDTLVLNVFNNIMFKQKQDKIALESISRSHRVGRPASGRGPRDIIVKFVSYRDRAKVYGSKKNLKGYNNNPSKQTARIFINEALTHKRAHLYSEARALVKQKKINSCWTFDGRVYVKLLGVNGKKMVINSPDDLESFSAGDNIPYSSTPKASANPRS
ncbi:uncharacterized protein LOC128180457 [Crassostrea angulata]|uniref:uncharacterized protein LOC128180457 n=1 Tax=Magallana angulata TaxID=2784310 RepID=UPI0022B106BC|nr:uncharacterized protein LOC128180457 [Crassostrea angulata]